MFKDILTSLRAITAGYFFDVIGITLVMIALSFTPLKGAYWVYLIVSILFIVLGGYIASNVSRRYRLINSTVVGLIHILWALYRGGYIETTHVLAIQILAVPLAVLGGLLSKKQKPVVREVEQI
ncbi:hypothetical protein GC093_01855 [Paenibacillus sp. LMG 31456]|uniref:Uncharacterized protein n=1 Tax=Paenibacillus foliorum TaxID=2654974 RepID=A0A972GWT0_9BACL|nr:hypothetical protein [Paenibacillus foliorum]NOU91981.1 hypothetical protein [Paenibacillus foliorum]